MWLKKLTLPLGFFALLTACDQSIYVAPARQANALPSPSATATASPTPVPTNTPSPVPTPQLGTSLYVVDANSIAVFPTSANGNVAPTYAISGPQSGLVLPIAAAFDASGDLYVANSAVNSGNARAGNVLMFKPPFNATSAPASTLSYANLTAYVYDVALDASGNIYVLCGGYQDQAIFVFAPGASGNASPTRIIPLDMVMNDYVAAFALDATTIYISGSQTNQIYEIPIGSSSAPVLTILGGAATGLNGPYGLRIDSQGELVVRNIGNKTVSRFAGGSSGNVAPLSTIDVSGFAGVGDARGLCLDTPGNLFLPHDDTQHAASAIGFFPMADVGSVAPTRTISGTMTGLDTPIGCVVR